MVAASVNNIFSINTIAEAKDLFAATNQDTLVIFCGYHIWFD